MPERLKVKYPKARKCFHLNRFQMPDKYPKQMPGKYPKVTMTTFRAFGIKYPKPQISISPIWNGLSYGGSKKMETIAAGVSALPKNGARARADKSPTRSRRSSLTGPAKDDTLKAAKTLSDLDARLSIMRTAYEQALAAGLQAQSQSKDGKTLIVLHGVVKCPNCSEWRMGNCPTCPNTSINPETT